MREHLLWGFSALMAAAVGAAYVLGGCGTETGDRWVVESVGYSGARIGMPGQPEGRHYATCVKAVDYGPNYDGRRDWPFIEVTVSRSVADRLNFGDPCPEPAGENGAPR